MNDHDRTIRKFIAVTVDLERNTAQCVKNVRDFWAMYSNASVDVQNDMLDERTQTLITMDLLCDALNEAADELATTLTPQPKGN